MASTQDTESWKDTAPTKVTLESFETCGILTKVRTKLRDNSPPG
jgi:hypothetical protein